MYIFNKAFRDSRYFGFKFVEWPFLQLKHFLRDWFKCISHIWFVLLLLQASAVRHEMFLLSNLLQLEDHLWEQRIRCGLCYFMPLI